MENNAKARIIEAALKLFRKQGFYQVSVRNIVEQAKISNGGFYHHFKSKDELLYFINDQIMSHVIAEGQKAIENYENPVEQLRGLILSFVRAFDKYNLEVTIMYQESHYLVGEYEEKIREKRNQYEKMYNTVLIEGVKAKVFRSDLPLKITGFMIFGQVNWTYKWYEAKKPLTIDEIADIYINFVFSALLTDRAKEIYSQYISPVEQKAT
ncbi:hypothetical protein BTR23_19695 [Alkalihalophilus pseudofirmus]|nr:hypothetical protein BTR23_19695 [Alkalihalophilus pseudofirmus]